MTSHVYMSFNDANPTSLKTINSCFDIPIACGESQQWNKDFPWVARNASLLHLVFANETSLFAILSLIRFQFGLLILYMFVLRRSYYSFVFNQFQVVTAASTPTSSLACTHHCQVFRPAH